jgi:hypothetical protein
MSSGVTEADGLRTGNSPKGTFLPAGGYGFGALQRVRQTSSLRALQVCGVAASAIDEFS